MRLLVADDGEVVSRVLRGVDQLGFPVDLDVVVGYDMVKRDLQACGHDAYLLGTAIDGGSPLEMLREVGIPQRPVILLMKGGDLADEKRALELGACDYLDREALDPDIVRRSIRYALEMSRWKRELDDARQRAESAIRTHSRLFKKVSYELRTPLNAIIGMTQLSLASDLTPFQREYLEAIEAAADSLLTVVNDVLDMAHLEAGELRLVSTRFRLPDVIREAVRTLAPVAKQRRLQLTVHNLHNLPTEVVGDPGRIRQVLLNLIDNAIAFTPEGKVMVAAGVVEESSDEVVVRFAVRDTGVGIPPERLATIFSPQQAPAADVTGREGSGLGLRICADLVRRMGGEIWAESEVGVGSTFQFTARFGLADRLEPVAGGPLGNWVLVITDHVQGRGAIVDVLKRSGVEATEFTAVPLASAAVALSRHPEQHPAAVLIDTEDAFASARAVLSDPHLGTLPVLLIAPSGRRGDAAECAALGVRGYLAHPVSPVELLEAVQAVMQPAPAGAPLVTRHWLRENRRRLKVLVADDSPTNRAVLLRSLGELGHQAEVAVSGVEAVEAVQRGAFDLVLMDLQMPEMDGLAATAAIRAWEEERGIRTPILGISAHAYGDVREEAQRAGMDDYLPKPFRIETLHFTMDRLMRETAHTSS